MEIGRTDYQERREAKIERLRNRAASKAQEARATGERAHKIADMIPFGEPIKIGHHSEGRHRRDIGRINSLTGKAIEASEAAQSLAARADAAEENKAISSDDPEALDRLKVKLASIEAERAKCVAINKAIRAAKGDKVKAVANLRAMGFAEFYAWECVTPDFAGRIGVPAYRLSNLSGNAGNVKKRIEALEAKAARDKKKTLQFFPTPMALAMRMVEMASIRPGERVLEPSAGTGAILKAIVTEAWGMLTPPPHIDVVEIDEAMAKVLRGHRAAHVHCADFMEFTATERYHRVIMNPPFYGGADVEHILLALEFLRCGGRLVAICANGSKQEAELKPLATTWEELPAGTFPDANVRTVLLTIDKE
jgi:predicted RNA methylase